jgi:predicted amidohydrolase
MFWGGSEVIDPSGNTVTKAGYHKEEQIAASIDMLKLKHARINTTLLGDEKLDIVIEELTRIKQIRKDY